MRTDPKPTLRFGDLIACVYSKCTRRDAKAVVRFAVNQQMIVFRGRRRFVVC